MMTVKTLRWIGFIPFAAILSVGCGIGITLLLPARSYSSAHPILSIVSPWGLAPEILERLLPVALFVVIGTASAPTSGRKVVAVLGVLGGLFGWPFGAEYMLRGHAVFYAAAASGTLVGCALGLLVALRLQAKRRNSGES